MNTLAWPLRSQNSEVVSCVAAPIQIWELSLTLYRFMQHENVHVFGHELTVLLLDFNYSWFDSSRLRLSLTWKGPMKRTVLGLMSVWEWGTQSMTPKDSNLKCTACMELLRATWGGPDSYMIASQLYIHTETVQVPDKSTASTSAWTFADQLRSLFLVGYRD